MALPLAVAPAPTRPPIVRRHLALGEPIDELLPPAHSLELDEYTPEPEPRDVMLAEVGATDLMDRDPIVRRALELLYGDSFPLLDPGATEEKWCEWAEALWDRHTGGVQARLHLVERNRFFRKSVQWISARGLEQWREPPKPRDTARVVYNVIKPALDQRIQLVSEQRPGFQLRPATRDPDDVKKAEAKQVGLEYQWDQQNMPVLLRELAYWAGTDGAAFLEQYWDPEAGPWHEAYTVDAAGGQVPAGPDGEPAPPGAPPHRFRLGDIRARVLRVEQVRVSAEATGCYEPWYWVVREQIPAALAVRLYGPDVVEKEHTTEGRSYDRLGMMTTPAQRLGYQLPAVEDELFTDQETVTRYTVYCKPSEFMKQGMHLLCVGKKVVYRTGLQWGVVPISRFTDGTTDPSFFPAPIMDDWIDCQMRINALLSKWVENIRLNAGPRLLGKENSIAGETLVGGTMTMIAAKGLGPINDIVRPLDGFSLAPDVDRALQLEMKAFADLSGWNDVTRGQFSSEQSGRAILAIRETVERIFAPPIQAAADFAVHWAKVACAGMKWGYDIPRLAGVVGKGRGDLARSIQSDDFDGATDVFVDPETLTPMPRSMRLFLLKELVGMGVMGIQEYRRRLPFAWIRNLGHPDEDQEARAYRVVEAIRQTGDPMALPVLWMDDEAIHQDVLQRELILPDDGDPMIRQAAIMRWNALAMQSQMKMGVLAPYPPPSGPGGGGESQGGGGAGGESAAPSGTAVQTYGGADARGASREFDARNPS